MKPRYIGKKEIFESKGKGVIESYKEYIDEHKIDIMKCDNWRKKFSWKKFLKQIYDILKHYDPVEVASFIIDGETVKIQGYRKKVVK